MSFMRLLQSNRLYFLLIFTVVLACRSNGKPALKPQVTYELSFENRLHHEAYISVTYTNLPPDPLTIIMSRSSPGRYALHEFAKNIYDIKAFNSTGKALSPTRLKSNQWRIENHDGTVRFTYILYGNQLDGTYTSITNDYILLNIPASLVFTKDLKDLQITVKVVNPVPEWSIYTQLGPTGKAGVFHAPDIDYLMDSPIEIGDFMVREWEMTSKEKVYRFVLTVNHKGSAADVDAFAKMIKPVIREQVAVFGELPDFEYGTYYFMTHYLPHAVVDGMEHRNSTVITRHNDLANYKRRFLMTLAHEFFHSWDMERLRPASIQPYNMEDTSVCGELWFAEGAPVYYDDLFLTRAGYRDLATFVAGINLHLNKVVNSPAHRYHSAVDISHRASLLDGAVYEDQQNNENIYISYYDFGDVICMGLDLLLRTTFKNLSLDDYINILWYKYGRKEIPYTNQDLRDALAELTSNPEFADDFFNRYIYGKELPDYKSLFAHAGILYRRKQPKVPYLGEVLLVSRYNAAILRSPTLVGTPLYEAGLDIDDAIIVLAGKRIKSAAAYYNVLATLRPGQTVGIEFMRAGKYIHSKVTVAYDPEVEIVPYERAHLPITDEIKTFRRSWTGSRAESQYLF